MALNLGRRRQRHRPFVRSRPPGATAVLKRPPRAVEWNPMRARMRGQEGFTLVELLTAMAISLVVGAAALTLVDIAAPQSDRELQREVAVGEGRAGLERMLREIRNADLVNATSPTLIDVNTPTASGAQRVVYQCNSAFQAVQYRQCVRYSGPVGGSVANGQVVVERLINGTTSQPVFTYVPDRIRPRLVRVQIVLPASGGPAPGYMHRVVFRDAAFLRNLDLTGG
jgi:prepilin-type N-terminal cleavage/methylation domain-containing protein